MTRHLRVLHSGNVANNGYLNAKLLRRAGVEADALCDEWHILSQPEWEDAPLEAVSDHQAPLPELAARVGWSRPPWVLTPNRWDPEGKTLSYGAERLRLASQAPQLARTFRRLRGEYGSLRAILGTDLKYVDVLRAGAWRNRLESYFGALGPMHRRYDLVQAYGIHPILLLLGEERPFLAFEHGTMRELPFEDDWYGRLLSLAYRKAAKVFITNPDVIASARRLELENYEFLPHPIDETKYTPGAGDLRRQFEAEGFDFVAVAPSRHDWEIKGTDRMLRAFAELVHRDRPHALLVLSEWGLELDRSRALIAELGFEANVRWVPPLPKLRLIDAYRSADVVLDQFEIGTFGAVAPEAMACGRPVVMAFDQAIHAWCMPVLPPVLNARTPEQIYAELRRLVDDDAAGEAAGREGRQWIEAHHGWERVVRQQTAAYAELQPA
jgi:glycosyltransferase involved in cell wall biosynthesis